MDGKNLNVLFTWNLKIRILYFLKGSIHLFILIQGVAFTHTSLPLTTRRQQAIVV